MELFDGGGYTPSGIEALAEAQGQSYGDSQQVQDTLAENAISDILATSSNRNNIRNSPDYNPIFAQAFNMSRGLQPGNRIAGNYPASSEFQGIADLARPSYLQPQIRGADGTMYFSEGERFLQETLPPIIQGVRDISPTGIIMNLIQQGQDAYNKGKGFLEETFTPEKKSDVGIMQNMNRADANNNLKALMAGYDNARMNPVQINPNLQTAGLNLDDVQKFVTSPGVVGKALDYAQPFIQNVLPDNVKVDTGLIYNQEKPEDSYTGIKFTIPFN